MTVGWQSPLIAAQLLAALALVAFAHWQSVKEAEQRQAAKQAERRAECAALPVQYDRDVRALFEAFRRTEVGRKWAAMSLQELAAAKTEDPELKDTGEINALMAGVESAQNRYRVRANDCKKEGFDAQN